MTATEPTTLLAAHARALHDRPLPADVREKAVICLLDAVGLAQAARDDSTAAAVRTLASGNAGVATVWATGERVSAPDAALLNGVAAHAHFHDDTDMDAWAHPGSLIVPAVAALAEYSGRSLDTLVRGVVAGYTALNWLGAYGEVGGALVARGFRASPTLGSIAAAVGAATVLGLEETVARNAIGLAADVTSGTLEPVRTGAQDWRWQNGVAAWRGTTAGLLAAAGLRGPVEPLAGQKGFLAAFCGIDPPAAWADPPRAEAIRVVWFKRYPILGDNTAAAVTAAALRGELADPAAITGVDVHINAHFAAYPGTAYRGPFDTIEQATASTVFAVAALLADGDITYAGYPAQLADPRIAKLIEKIRVIPESGYGYLDATVSVTDADGTHTRHASDVPRATFFRDRAAARQAYARATSGPATVPDALFRWLDGGPEPALAAALAPTTEGDIDD